MRTTITELRRIIRKTIQESFPFGKNPGPREKASQLRGLRHLGVVHAGPMKSKKKVSSGGISREEKIRLELHNVPFEEHGSSYMRSVRDILEKHGVEPESSEEWAWTEWYQQSEGMMDAWHVKNTIPDYTTVPSHWPKQWLRYPGDPSEGFYS